MTHIAMLLTNPYRPDPRVLKEARSLARLGHTVTVICWDRAAEMKPEETLDSGVRIVRVQSALSAYGLGAQQLFRLPKFWQAAFALLADFQPDIVHCHDFDTLPAGLLWGRLHRRPVIYDAHEHYADFCRPRLRGVAGEVLYRLIKTTEIIGARLASAVVTVDETLAAIYRRLNKRVLVVGHYPEQSLADRPAPVFTRPELTLLYVGRLSADRGLLVYADVLRALLAHGIPARLRLAGVFTPQGEEERFYEQCRGLESALDVVGWVHYHDIPALLHNADVGLSVLQPEPRYQAALPVKLFEYMAAGLPVVASNFPPIAAVVNGAECGVLVNPLDPQEIARHIRSWWENPHTARAMSESGRRAILSRYNWEALIGQLNDLYGTLGNN